MDKSKYMLTIKLKLHKPSKRKRDIIDEAMDNYARACEFLLDTAKKNVDEIRQACEQRCNGKYRAASLGGWMDKKVCRDLNQFQVEPFKDSLKIDVATMLATYFTAKQKNQAAGYPTACVSDHKPRPIFFCRYATNRNYSILYNPETGKYYAKIYLMNVRNEKRMTSNVAPEKVLIYIDKEKTVFKDGGGKKTYLLFPLSFGSRQQEYLHTAMEQPEMLKTARLSRENGEYYLSINLALDKPEEMETVNYLGIARGIENSINYSVVDGKGLVLERGNEASLLDKCAPSAEINRKNLSQSTDIPNKKNVLAQNNVYTAAIKHPSISYNAWYNLRCSLREDQLHKLANVLIDLAVEHECKIILENLVDRSDGLEYVDKDGKKHVSAMDSRTYNRLCDIIEYKMEHRGLPPAVRASGVNLFCTCTSCGTATKANRFSDKLLICTNCGTSIDVEVTGSDNLATRLLKYSKDKIKVSVNVEKEQGRVRFLNKDLDLDFCPEDPYHFLEEFKEEMNRLMQNFFVHISRESNQANFKKKYSLIKKLQSSTDILSVIHLE